MRIKSVREMLTKSERDVKKDSRDFNKKIANLGGVEKVNALQAKCNELLRRMKVAERDLSQSKKKNEQLQKEKDTAKSELNKTTSMKVKLENLSRNVNNENKQLQVR